MSIKKVSYDDTINVKEPIYDSDGNIIGENVYVRTDFIADTENDITAMNTSGSDYLKYPTGSCVRCLENGKIFTLNGTQTIYVEVI